MRRLLILPALTVTLIACGGGDDDGTAAPVVTPTVATAAQQVTTAAPTTSTTPATTEAAPTTIEVTTSSTVDETTTVTSTVPQTTAPAPLTISVAASPPPATPAPTPRPTPPPPYSVGEIAATVGPAAQAWALAPSGPSYDALVVAARSVLGSGRALPPAPAGDTGALLTQLTVYPGSDSAVLAIFDQLGPAMPAVSRDAFTTTTQQLRVQAAVPQVPTGGGTDPQFPTCKAAKAAGYGPYRQGQTEYNWYRDADSDGIVCE